MRAAYDFENIQKQLRQMMTEKRYEHTLGVTYTACALAMCHGTDLLKARVAGLLHDCAKCLPDEEKISLLREHGETISELELTHPGLLHARAGAIVANHVFHVDDPEVLTAIRMHTTGAPAMSKLSEIIYVADYIEPHRHRAPNLEELRHLAFHDLPLCVCRIMEQTMRHLSDVATDESATDPMTEKAWMYYTDQIKNRRRTD